MLKNSAKNFLIGCLAFMIGFSRILLCSLGLITDANSTMASFLIIGGFLLIGFEFFKSQIHLDLISKYFLKDMHLHQRLSIRTYALEKCLEKNYHDWWKSQRKQGLNNDHVSFGIFISILSGVLTKKDINKYSEHCAQCPTCRQYVELWNTDLTHKAKMYS